MRLNRHGGFSLVNVLIATALIALMSMGLAGMLSSMNRETKSLSNKMNKINLAQDLRVMLADSQTCTSVLGGQVYNPSGESNLIAKLNAKTEVKEGATLSDYGIIIKRFYAANPVSAGTSVGGAPLYVGELMLEAQEMAGAPGETGRSFKSSHAGMTYFELDPAGTAIRKCYALESGDDLLALACQKFNGIYNAATRECDTISNHMPAICSSMGGAYNASAKTCTLKPLGPESCAALGGKMTDKGCKLEPPQPDCQGPIHPRYPGAGTKDYPAGSTIADPISGGSWDINGEMSYGLSCTRICAGGVWAISNCTITGSRIHPSCFVMGTQITRADGSMVNIEDLRPGDELASANGIPNRVVRMERVRMGGRLLFSVNGEKAFVTSEHPFWTPAGWKSIDPAATALENPKVQVVGALKVGDKVLRNGSWLTIQNLRSFTEDANTVVYNPVLTGDHTYFADGYLVHNKH